MRSIKLGETDRLITLLSPEKGRISAVAKGARKTKSKLSAAVDLFVCGDYVLFKGKNLFTVTQCSIIRSFPALNIDFNSYAYATYFAEIVQRVIVEDDKSDQIFDLLTETLALLSEASDHFMLARAFELKLLSVVGYHPGFDECICCRSKRRGFFSSMLGGLVCDSCKRHDRSAVFFSEGSVALARFMIGSPLQKAGIVKAGERQRQELYTYNSGLIQHHLDINECKSLKYISRHIGGG